MFGRLLCWYRINIFSVPLARNGILPCAIFTLCTNLALSYIGSVTAWHSTSGHQPNFVALNKRVTPIFGRAANTLGIGPHSSCECICGLLMFDNSTTWSWGNYPILGRASKKGGGQRPPMFGPCLLLPNGSMDQDATWHGGRPHCVTWGSSSPKGAHPAPIFGPCLLWPKWSPIWATAEHLL